MSADKTELRQLLPSALLQALDAIAMAKGMTRHDYVERVLDMDARRVAHEASVVARCLRGNPYGSESDGVAREPASKFHA